MLAHAPNTLQLELKNSDGDTYQIQVAWPLAWDDPKAPGHSASIMYAILKLRSAPRGIDGQQQTAPHGGATRFLEFLVGTVRTTLLTDVFCGLSVIKEILIGHSLGGLCTLHALFQNTTPFDTFIALSPSIWWNNEFILGEAERFLKQRQDGVGSEPHATMPSLMIIYGSLEQERRCHPSWSEDKYRRVKALSQERKMKDNADALANRLRESGQLSKVRVKEYQDEDHGSVVGGGISWAVGAVLDEGRFFSDEDD
ncbi:hypothetical protein APSETT444_009673 [Aspergillus pseudonomiae]